jgi:histidine decarboxylase
MPMQGMAPVSDVFPADALFHQLEIRIQAIQLSPYHAGPPTPRSIRLDTAVGLLACSCPLSLSASGKPSKTQEHTSSSSRLNRGYDRAPRGALLNNVGDPDQAAVFPAHTKDLERKVVDIIATLLRAPRDDRWGYVTTGGSEGVEYGLLLARTLYPDAVTYASTTAHWCVSKITNKLRMPAVTVRALPDGRMDLRDLLVALRQHRHCPAVVVANIGTTMTEAVDDVTAIRRVLADAPISRAFVHADAALSGLPLALLPPEPRIGFDLADGADCVSLSGHKLCGAQIPCGVVVTRRSLKTRRGGSVELLGTHDTTIGGSRSGHAPLILWYALHSYGLDGLRDRVRYARDMAAYTVDQLDRIGWPAWRHPHAMTVVLDPPPAALAARWAIPISDGKAHIITLPHVTAAHIGAFIAELTGPPHQLHADETGLRIRAPYPKEGL